MPHEKQNRCVNIDWLELYVLEPADRYPLNAEYFTRQGFLVRERDYGTRVYKEMFEIINSNGDPLIEIRRNPASGDSSFSGLCPESCHMRLPNWILYQQEPIQFLSGFLLQHGYIFKRIYRLDIAYDFELFDSGDKPSRFVRRYLEGKYRKVNQCSLTAHGEDTWNNCNWNSLSWGSRTSMVSTKLYNKTKELTEAKNSKPYIRRAWMEAGLIDNPLDFTKTDAKGKPYKAEIWRLEYSLKSSCDGWIVIEMEQGRKVKKQHIPHRLPLFDSPNKLWQRFQDLTYHYFRFKHKEYKDLTESSHALVLESVHSDYDRPLKRKYDCRDKKLFYFDTGHQFTQLSQAPSSRTYIKEDDVLERRLKSYRDTHFNVDIRKACDVILKNIELNRLVNYSPEHNYREARALQLTLARKMGGDPRNVVEILTEIMQLINSDSIY